MQYNENDFILEFSGKTIIIVRCKKSGDYYKNYPKQVKGIYLKMNTKSALDFLKMQGNIEMKKLNRQLF